MGNEWEKLLNANSLQRVHDRIDFEKGREKNARKKFGLTKSSESFLCIVKFLLQNFRANHKKERNLGSQIETFLKL